MEIFIYTTRRETAAAAAEMTVGLLTETIEQRGEANLLLDAGAGQIDMLEALAAHPVEWSKVTAINLAEYVGLPAGHDASQGRRLRKRLVERVANLGAVHFIDPADDPSAECSRIGEILRSRPIDVACVGIGEDGSLGFNAPPADFEAEAPCLVVDLSDTARRRLLDEGAFETFKAVPAKAVSMSIRQIMASRTIVCAATGECKARAVRETLERVVHRDIPASIFQEHDDCRLMLDEAAASMLRDP